MDHDLRRRLARAARSTHGIVTREELLELGLTSATIDWAIRAGHLEVLVLGVYRVNGTPDSWRGRALAAQRRVDRQLRRKLRPGQLVPVAAIGAGAAGHLHDLPGHRRPPAIVVATSARSRSSVATTRCLALTPADITTVDGIPVTSLAWTAVERAGRSAAEPREDLLAHLLGTGRLRRGQLIGVAHRAVGLPGRAAVAQSLMAMVPDASFTRSDTERRLAAACMSTGLPRPDTNRRVEVDGDGSLELDLAWLDPRLDVEVDGPHHLLPTQRRRDRQRDRRLRAAGWEVVRVQVEEVDEDLDGVVARIATTLTDLEGRST